MDKKRGKENIKKIDKWREKKRYEKVKKQNKKFSK